MSQIITDFDELLELIQLLPATKHSNVIGLSGFGGSGKSTVAAKLAEALEEAATISTDDFMLKNYKERSGNWACIDRQRLVMQVLRPAENGTELNYQVYDWATGRLGEARRIVGRNIIVEGIGIIHPQVIPYFDFSIWLDVDLPAAVQRGMRRDKEILGVDNDSLWQKVWMPNDQEYFDKYRPDRLADCIYRPLDV